MNANTYPLEEPTMREKNRNRGGCYVHPGSEYTDEEIEFIKAIDKYKRRYHRINLSTKEVLWIARELGYRRVNDGADLPESDTHKGG